MLKRSLRVFLLDCGNCGGCALEAQAALTKRYRPARRGIREVGTAVHADVLVVCGPPSAPLAEAVQRLGETLARPSAIVFLGVCGPEEYAGIAVPGCPPSPEDILAAIEQAGKKGPAVASLPQAREDGPGMSGEKAVAAGGAGSSAGPRPPDEGVAG